MTEEHKGLPVPGYRPQQQQNIDLVTRNKVQEEIILRIFDELKLLDSVDQRWLAIAKTDIEKGFMSMNRAIFKPDRIQGELSK